MDTSPKVSFTQQRWDLTEMIASALRSYRATSLIWKHNVSTIYPDPADPKRGIIIEFKNGETYELSLIRTDNVQAAEEEDTFSHRYNSAFCAKCGGTCQYDDQGKFVGREQEAPSSASVREVAGEGAEGRDESSEAKAVPNESPVNATN